MSHKENEGFLLDNALFKTYDSIDSTNLEAKRILNGLSETFVEKPTRGGRFDYKEPIIINSIHQTHGIGRSGKKWISPKEKDGDKGNIYMTIIISEEYVLESLRSILSLVSSLSVYNSLQSPSKEEENHISSVKFKWPNDIQINKQKLGGVLIEQIRSETISGYFIIGIGINISSYPEPSQLLKGTASCLQNHGLTISIQDIYRNFIKLICNSDKKEIIKSIREKLDFINFEVAIGNQKGIFLGINDDGNAIIHNGETNENQTITFGDMDIG